MVKTPIEMREDILDSIAEYVTQNTKMKAVDGPFCKLLRENLDRKFGPAWHVFVGKNFGCYAIHDNNSFANFKYKGYTYLIYKTTVWFDKEEYQTNYNLINNIIWLYWIIIRT